MAYSRCGGSPEGASLIFAHSVKEAKPVAWKVMGYWLDGEYTDLAVCLLKNSDHLFSQANQEKLKDGMPHGIETPICCNGCGYWGYEMNKEGYCQDCWE